MDPDLALSGFKPQPCRLGPHDAQILSGAGGSREAEGARRTDVPTGEDELSERRRLGRVLGSELAGSRGHGFEEESQQDQEEWNPRAGSGEGKDVHAVSRGTGVAGVRGLA
jgi:hypothetical protein